MPISIPIELISYIADALDITEQELFDTTRKTRKRYFKYFIDNAEIEELEQFNSFVTSKITNNININYGQVFMSNTNLKDEKVENLKELLEFAPQNFLDRVVEKLEEYRELGKEL
jgi:DNA replicative helicase MCM subunit Mcm2 (Cdc46/Mcm family)